METKKASVKHTARYFSVGVYFLRDQSAGALCRMNSDVLPPRNHWAQVKFRTGKREVTAALMRTPANYGQREGIWSARGWVWTISDLRVAGQPVKLGHSFKFLTPAAATQADVRFPVASDHRYAITREEYAGGRVSYALRFGGEFLMSSPFYESAANAATKHATQS